MYWCTPYLLQCDNFWGLQLQNDLTSKRPGSTQPLYSICGPISAVSLLAPWVEDPGEHPQPEFCFCIQGLAFGGPICNSILFAAPQFLLCRSTVFRWGVDCEEETPFYRCILNPWVWKAACLQGTWLSFPHSVCNTMSSVSASESSMQTQVDLQLYGQSTDVLTDVPKRRWSEGGQNLDCWWKQNFLLQYLGGIPVIVPWMEWMCQNEDLQVNLSPGKFK